MVLCFCLQFYGNINDRKSVKAAFSFVAALIAVIKQTARDYGQWFTICYRNHFKNSSFDKKKMKKKLCPIDGIQLIRNVLQLIESNQSNLMQCGGLIWS